MKEAPMETLKRAILRLEPKIDLLHDCLGFGRFAEITITSDGYFLGRAWGDIGFNHFLGQPSSAAIARTQALFDKLPEEHQAALIRTLRARGIPPEALGIPIN
jgi:hypothetical protein